MNEGLRSPAWWDPEADAWVVETDRPLTPEQVRRVTSFVLKIQQRRLERLGGQAKVELEAAVAALEQGKVAAVDEAGRQRGPRRFMVARGIGLFLHMGAS